MKGDVISVMNVSNSLDSQIAAVTIQTCSLLRNWLGAERGIIMSYLLLPTILHI